MDEGLRIAGKQDEHIAKLHKYQEKINTDQYKRSTFFSTKTRKTRFLEASVICQSNHHLVINLELLGMLTNGLLEEIA